MVKISILDYAQIDAGETAQRAIANSVRLAQHAEALGFHRFWVAEHHDVPAFVSSSPELLMMHLADQTNTIRIGSGGIMIPHYSPYKVAENIQILQATHPQRIDVGLGNTVGTPLVNAALNEKRHKLGYQSAIRDLQHYLSISHQPQFRFDNLVARPQTDLTPQLWMLSTSVANAIQAAEMGLGYCFGLFPNLPGDKFQIGKEAIQTYHETFQDHPHEQSPQTMVAIFAAIAETEQEAQEIAQSINLWLLGQNNFQQLKTIPTIEEARNYNWSRQDKEKIRQFASRIIVGSRQTIKERIEQLITHFNCDEILLCTIMPGIETRLTALGILSDVFQLKNQPSDH